MSVRIDVINLNINVNGNQALNKLNQLCKQSADLNFELKSMKKGTQEYADASRALGQVNNRIKELKQQIGIAALSQKELTKELRTLTAFKLQVVDDVEKGRLTYKQAQTQHGIQGRSTVLVWLRKHGTLDWNNKLPMKKKAPPKTYISQLEAKIRRLEEEKEILNRAIDVADDLFSTDIRKKYLPLSLHLTKNKGQNERPEA